MRLSIPLRLSIPVRIAIGANIFLLAACAPAGHLPTITGGPQVAVHSTDWKNAVAAIADYNFSKGRKLDYFRSDELALYEAVPSTGGTEEVTSKTVYHYTVSNDSLIIWSERYRTDDLDDESASVADDQATLDAEQQELHEIALKIDRVSAENLAAPQPTR